MVLMVGVTIMLPQMSGLATYAKNPEYLKKQRERETERRNKGSDNYTSKDQAQSYTYEAPDAYIDGDDDVATSTSSAFKGVRSKLSKIAHAKVTESDIPVKLELFGENDLKRRAKRNAGNSVGKIGINNDPNEYDYDLDAFIEEENINDSIQQQKEAARKYGTSDV